MCPRQVGKVGDNIAFPSLQLETHKRRRKSPRLGIRHRRLGCEPLEDRRMLSIGSPQLEMFRVSPALFVENLGQWADESVRFVHQGDGVNVAMTDAGPVFQLF